MLDARLFLIRLTIKQNTYRTFLTWFASRHASALIESGFFSANSFLVADHDQSVIFNIHEIPGVEVFETDTYRELVLSDSDFKNNVAPNIVRRSNTIYRQVEQSTKKSAEHLIEFPTSTTVVVLALSDEFDDLSALTFFRTEFLSTSRSVAGFSHARLCTKDGEHPFGPSTEATWVVISEWTNKHSAGDFLDLVAKSNDTRMKVLESGSLVGRLLSPSRVS